MLVPVFSHYSYTVETQPRGSFLDLQVIFSFTIELHLVFLFVPCFGYVTLSHYLLVVSVLPLPPFTESTKVRGEFQIPRILRVIKQRIKPWGDCLVLLRVPGDTS